MQVMINGEPAELSADTLQAALSELELEDATVATAVNGDFVPVRFRAGTAIHPGDRIEIFGGPGA